MSSFKVGDKVVKRDGSVFLNGANVSVVTRVCKNTIKVPKGGWVPVDLPYWNENIQYRVTLPNKEAAQLKQQIAVLQSRLKELEGENK
jgi:hypothetical protein